MASSTKILRALGAFGTGALVGGGSVAAMTQSGGSDNENPSLSSTGSHPTVLKYGAPAPLTAGVFCYSNHCLEFDPSRRNGCQRLSILAMILTLVVSFSYPSIMLLQFSIHSYRTPIWVAEHIDRTKVEPVDPSQAANRKKSKFKPDMALAAEIRASNEDFWDSGWSRGHMAPAGNNKVLNRRQSQK